MERIAGLLFSGFAMRIAAAGLAVWIAAEVTSSLAPLFALAHSWPK